MSRISMSTPCPTSIDQQAFLRKTADETTATLNFTTPFDASFRNIKPRRRQNSSVHFTIHEDIKIERSDTAPQNPTLVKPARRVTGPFTHPERLTASQISSESCAPLTTTKLSRLAQAPRRPVARLSIVPESASRQIIPAPQCTEPKNEDYTIKASRPARRRTIYIPNDDTTMPTMYMGVFSPIKDLEQGGDRHGENTMDLTGIAAQMAAKRGKGRRISMIDAAPRRAPLQTSTRILQDSTEQHDQHGQGGGKENRPPGKTGFEKSMLDLDLFKITSEPAAATNGTRGGAQTAKPRSHRMSLFEPTLSTTSKKSARKSLSVTNTQAHVVIQRKSNAMAHAVSNEFKRPTIKPRDTPLNLLESISEAPRSKAKVPSRFVVPVIQNEKICNNLHPVLTENISNPKLYEENWLGHQEVAITQLLNKLFVCASLGKPSHGLSCTLTQDLLRLYNTNGIAVLHNRLQAAILYGALSIPRDVLDQGAAIFRDLGRRQRFIDLWLNTYDYAALESSMEVVIGRQCRSSDTHSPNSKSSNLSPSKKILHQFIEGFLLRNEDANPDQEVRSRAAWSYQRTMIRSLMLIKTLDMVKTDRLVSFSGPLFLPTAMYKSSTAVLQTLFQLMNPSVGDPIRALHHIDYSVSHIQYPLEIFDYTINNLAVDLRDGVRLTRLIELLLYPSASSSLEHNIDTDAGMTTTILMPAGEMVDFQNGQDWPLSQHLKLPAQSRVARLWNVQVALSAAANVKGMANMVVDIAPEDIVDGFREKTIRLLWALVGKCGMASLINQNDLKWETRRLRLLCDSSSSPLSTLMNDESDELDIYWENDGESGNDDHQSTFDSCKTLLKAWVRAIAASKGIRLQNFTTSFADGRIFQAIMDTYEPMLLSNDQFDLQIDSEQQNKRLYQDSIGSLSASSSSSSSSSSLSSPKPSLSDRLTRIGCNQQFAQLFSTIPETGTGKETRSTSNSGSNHHIFDRDFILATLAFLCSRLLGPSHLHRNALVIQTQWRKYKQNLLKKQMLEKKVIAHACLSAYNRLNSTWRGENDVKEGDANTDGETKFGGLQSIPTPEESKLSGDIWLGL